MFWYLSEHANTRKHVSEHSCSSVRVFFSILAHLAHLAQSFFLNLNVINKCFDTRLNMQIQEHVREHNWSSRWVILSILAHRAHLAHSYFSLIFSAFNTYNCSWFNLTNKNNCNVFFLWKNFEVCLSMQIQENMYTSNGGYRHEEKRHEHWSFSTKL